MPIRLVQSWRSNKPKDEVTELLRSLPDDATLEDIQYHIYVRQRIARGEAEADAGKTIDNQEMRNRLSRWLDS